MVTTSITVTKNITNPAIILNMATKERKDSTMNTATNSITTATLENILKRAISIRVTNIIRAIITTRNTTAITTRATRVPRDTSMVIRDITTRDITTRASKTCTTRRSTVTTRNIMMTVITKGIMITMIISINTSRATKEDIMMGDTTMVRNITTTTENMATTRKEATTNWTRATNLITVIKDFMTITTILVTKVISTKVSGQSMAEVTDIIMTIMIIITIDECDKLQIKSSFMMVMLNKLLLSPFLMIF